MARLQAQFLPTQRSSSGRAPASSSEKRGSVAPQAPAASSAIATVASLERSSTSNTRQSPQGASLRSRLVRQAAMLAASL